MTEFTYKNVKNASISHTSLKLNCSYHPQVFFKDNIDFCSKYYFANQTGKRAKKINRYLPIKPIPRSKTPKKLYDKGVKPQNYASGEKIWLNSKYIKIKQN